jgi:hypothetical protein
VRTASVAVSLSCLLVASNSRAQELLGSPKLTLAKSAASTANSPDCQIVYLGFVGALEPANNKNSGVVQIRQTLQGKDYSDVCARSFSPYVWTEGRDWLMEHFPTHPGALTSLELQQAPKVILVGHSMGGWAIMSVARELRSHGIPVELTVQVDSVGFTDDVIPRNVKSAAIFHANDVLIFMTTKHVRLEDPNHTKIVADVKVAKANHQSITRDPRIRKMVMDMVEVLRAAGLAAESVPVILHPIEDQQTATTNKK